MLSPVVFKDSFRRVRKLFMIKFLIKFKQYIQYEKKILVMPNE
jgi:hypothetical protein